jgi:hypothetical protein
MEGAVWYNCDQALRHSGAFIEFDVDVKYRREFRIVLKHSLQIAVMDSISSEGREATFAANCQMNECSAQSSEFMQGHNALRTKVAVSQCEKFSFFFKSRGKKSLSHDTTERTWYFSYPQRLWIALSLTIVGVVSFLPVYIFFISKFCEALVSYRMQVSNILARIQSFVAAAPMFLELMTSNIEGLTGPLHLHTALVLST